MRDNALARELLRSGHEVTIAPMYLPLTLDETALAGLETTPIFFGGINVYLQQKLPFFRKTPAFFDRLLNTTGLLRWAARHSHMTSAREHGQMTLEMLQLESSRFRKEWEKLMGWLEQTEKPDVICLSTALLAGFSAEMKKRLRAPVVLFFQGEDAFLDGLPEPYRSRCWAALAKQLPEADLLLAPSRFYASLMRSRLQLPAHVIEVVPNGIDLSNYVPAEPWSGTPTIGYLARMVREKGLELLVEAFLVLTSELGDRTTRLKIGGAATAGDEPLLAELRRRLEQAGVASRVEWSPNLTLEQKTAFLRSLTLFSVPAVYAEAFGLYVIEAMATGIPVVQPEASAFPEIIGAAGGGVCVPPRDPRALALAWQQLLADPAQCRALGAAGRLSVEKHFNARTMSRQFCEAAGRLRKPALDAIIPNSP
ncbi:MAG: hypothetical protein RIQ93_972 [Verrucomicrobiota bacterium]|jgi:glycosyltransferase involved in cell wall biosynthesis